jgi:hypothetical protein
MEAKSGDFALPWRLRLARVLDLTLLQEHIRQAKESGMKIRRGKTLYISDIVYVKFPLLFKEGWPRQTND